MLTTTTLSDAYVRTSSADRQHLATVIELVRDRFDPALLKQPWRAQVLSGAVSASTGHCYAASEACFHLLGGRAAGWVAHVFHHEGSPHWFLRRRTDGTIVDPTADQFDTPVPYEQARPIGFLTGDRPSKRAQVFIDHVTATDPTLSPR
jgi:hypothetical protein